MMNEKPLRYGVGGDDVHVGDLCKRMNNGGLVYIVTGMPIVHAPIDRLITLPVAFSHCNIGWEGEGESERVSYFVEDGEVYSVRLLQRGHGMICQLPDMHDDDDE